MGINLNLLNGKRLPKKIWQTMWWVSIASIALVRMNLVSHDEIAPTSADSLNYATQANYYLAHGPFSGIPSQTPGLSIFAFATTQIGIPYKVSLDLLLILVALICCQLVSRLTSSRLCGLFTFGLIALNPWFMTKSKVFMTEPMIAVLIVALIASSYQYLFIPVRKWRLSVAFLAGIVSASFIVTRSEMPLILLFWFFVTVVALLTNWRSLKRKPDSPGKYRRLLVVLPLLMTIALTQFVKFVHQRTYGVAAMAATEASGFKDLINALYSIPPDENIRFAPVTMQSLALACDSSPTLNKYRTRLLATNSVAFESAKRFLGLEDEFGTWLNWHLIGSFGGVNGRSNAEMKQAADEIRLDQREGRLKKRIGIFPIDPLWREWLPDIPGELNGALALSINPGLYDQTKDEEFSSQVRDAVDIGIFDSGLLRRKGTDGNTVVRVFAQSQQTGFRRVRIKSSDGLTISDSHQKKTEFFSA